MAKGTTKILFYFNTVCGFIPVLLIFVFINSWEMIFRLACKSLPRYMGRRGCTVPINSSQSIRRLVSFSLSFWFSFGSFFILQLLLQKMSLPKCSTEHQRIRVRILYPITTTKATTIKQTNKKAII